MSDQSMKRSTNPRSLSMRIRRWIKTGGSKASSSFHAKQKSARSTLTTAVKALTNNAALKSTSSSSLRDVHLMSEAGYHWCPTYIGGWCSEGYLCGDGRNGCDFGLCCQDDDIISCPSDLEGKVLTPCSINSNPNGLSSESYCCDIGEICGDGTLCTNRCPKGECCEFSIDDVAEQCYKQEEEEEIEECLFITEECCEAEWPVSAAMEMAIADFTACNAGCTDNWDINEDESTSTLICNGCLGSFEYICQRERGTICAATVSFDDFSDDGFAEGQDGDAESDTDTYRHTLKAYVCLPSECSTDEDETIVEDSLSEYMASLGDWYENSVVEFECSEIPHLGAYMDVDFDPLESCREDCVCSLDVEFPVPRR